MKFKEYEMPDGRKAVFEYDENGVGKITLECMDMLMGLINDRKTENSSEKPNNCEHITEDGVTCAKYPACDGCLDNPLNKVKGSERLVKGSEQTEPTISKMEQVDEDINVRSKDEPKTQTETQNSNLTFEKRTMRDCYNCKRYETEGECIECHYEPKDEPQDEYAKEYEELGLRKLKELRKDEPQTDCAWK